MSGKASSPQQLHPLEQAEIPAVSYESEASPGLGRSNRYLEQERQASGGLDDDPTESGEPVRNRRSFKNLTGGR